MSDTASGAGALAIIPIRERDIERFGGMPTLGGRPLLAFTVDAARAARSIDRVVVSSDSPDLADLGRRLGAEAPFIRPPELSAQGVPLTRVLQHTVRWLANEQSYRPDVVVMLEITHPLRMPGIVDQVVQTLREQDLDSVFTAYEDRHMFWRIDEDGDLSPVIAAESSTHDTREPLYREASGLVSANKMWVVEGGERLGHKLGLVPVRHPYALVDVRDPHGLDLARMLVDAGHIAASEG